MDKPTIEKIKLAHPKIRESLLKDYKDANNKLGKGCRLRFVYVVRTDAEQDALYSLGRTKVNPDGKSSRKPMGNIVTNAKGGQSIHNYALAFDIVLMYDNNNDGVFEEVSWNMLKDGDHDGIADWQEMITFFKSRGYEWGGDWRSFKDNPHFQRSFGHTWRTLQIKKKNVETIVDNGIIYVKI